jgi:hypothetical protein
MSETLWGKLLEAEVKGVAFHPLALQVRHINGLVRGVTGEGSFTEDYKEGFNQPVQALAVRAGEFGDQHAAELTEAAIQIGVEVVKATICKG